MAEASLAPSPPLDMDGIVVDLHTNRAAAATAAQALLNENSNASSEAGINLKFPISFTSSSSESESEQFDVQQNPLHSRNGTGDDTTAAANGAARPSSPPPNCAICLGRCKNKCFTNNCVHQFCFKCLAEWSKVKAECPLCKQPFRSIIHNVKSIDQFEEYHVQAPTVQLPHSPLEVTYQGPLRGLSVNGSRSYYNFSMRSFPRSHAIPSRGPITIRNYLDHDFGAGGSISSASVAVNAAVETMPMRHADFFRRQMPDEYGNDLPVGQLWRRYIYDRKLYALPVSDITGRFRECSARFYRANPGQIVRLIPFANRDLVCLLRNTNHNVTRVLETLNEGLEVSNIMSRSFRRRLQPFLGERTAHFIHELSTFARSPYDMIGYDDFVQYAPYDNPIIEFSSSGGEETNNNNNANNNNNNTNNIDENPTSTSNDPRFRRNTRRPQAAASSNTSSPSNFPPVSLLSFTITTTTEGSEAPGVSVAVSAGSRGGHAQVAAINLSTHNRAHNEVVIDLDDNVEVNGNNGNGSTGGVVSIADSANRAANNAADNGSAEATSTVAHDSPQVVASIALSTSSSDECEFVLERKPPHLRTPEMVSLNSESDSDVVFIEETKPILAEATYSTSDDDGKNVQTLASLIDEQLQQRQREKLESERQSNDLEASTSTGIRSRTMRQIVAAKRSCANRLKTDVPVKRRRTRYQRASQAANKYSSDESTTDDDNDVDFANSKPSSRSRRRASSSSTKRRGTSNARKSAATAGRHSRKRFRASSISNKISKQLSMESPQEHVNELKRQIRPHHPERQHKNYKNTAQKVHYTSQEDSSTEEDDKENLKALQKRLKTSLSDVEASIDDQTMHGGSYPYSLAYSPQTTQHFYATSAGQSEELTTNSNSAVDFGFKSELNLPLNVSSAGNLDERPSTSAAAAAAAAAHMRVSSLHDESDTSDANNETNNASSSLQLGQLSPVRSASDTNLPQTCSPPSIESCSPLNSLQLPITSEEHLPKQKDKFSDRFKYSSSSDSSTNSSSSSSMTQSSGSATSASEDELN